MNEDKRRDPQDLLNAINKLENKSSRGRLNVFLGMCPGVGKTYTMLKAAIDQKNRGVHVLIGVVETHNRKETIELTTHLSQIPKKQIIYKQTTLNEMDIDTILKLKPDLVLVDELAHTNAEGSRHQKRYQDVDEILYAGIDVYTTLNIQHIESRNDQVAQITGVVVRETIPDSFLEQADQIQLIDLSVQDLLGRMQEGKVYLGEAAERAAQNFFKPEHLTALRELALRFTAEMVDQDLHQQMIVKGIEGPWNTNERFLVAISHSPYSSHLIRAARRMAYNLEAPWVALYVDTGYVLTQEDQETLQKNLALAKELGAEVVTQIDTDLVRSIQRVCEMKNVTQIIMGRPNRRFFRDIFSQGTVLDQLVSQTSNIDVHVIRTERKPQHRGFRIPFPKVTSTFVSYYITAWFMAAIGIICMLLVSYIGYRALGSIFLVAILTVSLFASRGPIIFSAIISAFTWNYFFIPPTFTFVVTSQEDMMMLLMFFFTAIVVGFLTTKIRRQEDILHQRENRMSKLFDLGKILAEASDILRIKNILQSTLKSEFDSEFQVLLVGNDEKLEDIGKYQLPLSEKEYAVARWSYENSKEAGWSTQTLSAASCLCLPMKGKMGNVGVVLFYPDKKRSPLNIDEHNFLETVVFQVAVAIERFHFSEAMQETKLLQESQKLHQTLLNSVSHELRTPITALIGTASALNDKNIVMHEAAREALTEELINSSLRLNQVVENLLDISRLENDTLKLNKEWFEVLDIIAEAKNNLKVELSDRSVTVSGDTAELIEGDFKLLEHALRNVLLNAIRYTPNGSPIEVRVQKQKDFIKILIKDEGPGFPELQNTQLFEKFYRLPGTPAGGLGLGLSIVKSIVELHGGKVFAFNRSTTEKKTGAIFEIKIPNKALPAEIKDMINENKS